MKRYELRDSQWRKIGDYLPGRLGSVGVTARDNRQFVNGVLWVLGQRGSLEAHADRIRQLEELPQPVRALGQGRGLGTDLQVVAGGSKEDLGHDRLRDRAGAPAGRVRKRGRPDQALGRSRGGMNTKTHMATEAGGRPMLFILTGGQAGDGPQAIPLLTGIKATHVIADKGYDTDGVLGLIYEQGVIPVIPPTSRGRVQPHYDRELLRERKLIERAFGRLKNWRKIATRYDRRSLYFLAALQPAAAITWSRQLSNSPRL